MQNFILSGAAIDLVLVVIALEFTILIYLRRKDWKRAALDLIFALAPGALLLLAVKLALTGGDWVLIAWAIAASFPFHLIDLLRRTRA